MKRIETAFINKVGDKNYKIYLIVNDDGTFDLDCKREIYALAWFGIFEDSIKDYKEGRIK
jgi:hypothetical protein